jgi:tRNA pseudouridine38-40 synthase
MPSPDRGAALHAALTAAPLPTIEPAVREDGGLVRVRLDIAYDGTDFAGWARQDGLRTVQGDLEAALATVLRLPAPPGLTVAGRTDAGVHARGQVAHADIPVPAWAAVPGRMPVPPAGALVRRLAGLLAPDVRVLAVAPAPPGFDARFSALARRYAYRVSDAPGGVDPLRRREVLWNPRRLDPELLNAAAAGLVGEHDFAAYCKPRLDRDGRRASTVRHLARLAWDREPDGLLVADVRADAFCHNMVRALVGALLAVGEGRRPPDWPAAVLAAGRRDSAVQVAPPHGLTLEEVRYPPDAALAARAEQTRRPREPAG